MNKIYSLLLLILLTNLDTFGQQFNWDTTYSVVNQKYHVRTSELTEEKVLLTIKRNQVKIVTDTLESGGLSDIEFIDFNKDKNPDILLTYIGNNPISFIYLFDKKSRTYKEIKGFFKFPEAKKLSSQADLYFSYHRAGCADMNWISDLFTIKNNTAVHLTEMYGQGCDTDDNPDKIEVYKIVDDKRGKLIDTLPIDIIEKYKGYKWEFIEAYWNQNADKLLKN